MSRPAHAFERREVVAATPTAHGLFLALAPMDGVTDWVYRDLMTGLHAGSSGISICVSEFVRVTHDPVPPKVIVRHCPEVDRGGRTRAGVPVFVQLLGGQPGPMAESATIAAQLGASGIDINFGCPARTVNNHDGGATILKWPRRVESIVSAVRQAVPAGVPVTVKVRLGWDSAGTIEEIARAAEIGGASWLTIHARTRTQGYRPPVDWEAIGRARRAIGIPVIANGDLNTADDLAACAEVSGCSAFMIGRGAMGRPELFRQVRGWADDQLSHAAFAELLADYVVRLLASGASERAALGRLKQWLRMGAPAYPAIHTLFDVIKRTRSVAEGLEAVSRFSHAGGCENAAEQIERGDDSRQLATLHDEQSVHATLGHQGGGLQ